MGLNAFVKASIRTYYSNNFIHSAAFFARQALAVEQLDLSEVVQEQKDQDQGFVLGSIIFSVTFLEALINEMAVDYSEERYQPYPKLANGGHAKIAKSWNQNLYHTSILEKYEHTLRLVDITPFEKGHPPYQDVNLLVKLRNSIIHYEPENIDVLNTNPDEHIDINKLEGGLRGKFEINALYDTVGYNYFPLKCFGHGCAQWAVQSVRSFANIFFEKLGISNHSQKQWNRLKTE